jgi:hypothetical protein
MRTTEPNLDAEAAAASREAEAEILAHVASAWARGWQPMELVRHVRRSVDAAIAGLALLAIAAETVGQGPGTIDPRWAAQLDDIDLPALRVQHGWLADWARRVRAPQGDAVRSPKLLCLYLELLPPLPILIPPPGASPATALLAGLASRADDPMLRRVRALLAQAESTQFEAEAETFTAKAQELITRHAIDGAMLVADGSPSLQPLTIRIAIDDPYAAGKCVLLSRIAQHSRCRAVLHNSLGLVSVTGLGTDIDATEMLFTSLLVQVQSAMQSTSARTRAGAHERSRSFRSSFVLAFAERIGERLAAINAEIVADVEATTGREIVPVLAARQAAIDAAVSEMFGPLQRSTSRRSLDGAGWAGGRLAADRARLNAGDLASSRKQLR